MESLEDKTLLSAHGIEVDVHDDHSEGASFDFGTSTSVVEAGYTGVTGEDRYDAALGYGWLSGNVRSQDRGTGAAPVALTQDMNETGNGTFVVDVASGTYDVTVTMGDSEYPRDGVNLYLEGELQATVASEIGEFFVQTFTVDVNDGQLTLQIQDDFGRGSINGLTIAASSKFQLKQVLTDTGELIENGQDLDPAPSQLTLRFNLGQEIDPSSLDGIRVTRAGMDRQFGNDNDVVVTASYAVDGAPNEVTLVFAEELPDDVYRIDISGTGATPLQNISGTAFNEGVDEYFTFTVGAQEDVLFDFGTSSSAVQSGYAQVTGEDRYSESTGYGWLSGIVRNQDRGVGANPVGLTQDLNETFDGTFVVDVAVGTYDVTVTMGDSEYPRDSMKLYLEGEQQATVTTEIGEFSVQTYTVVVDDGQLTMRIEGGASRAAINAMTATVSSDFQFEQILSDVSGPILDGEILDRAPNQLTLRFSSEQEIDPNSLDGIRVTRAGMDGRFGDTNDIVVAAANAFVSAPNEVTLVFADSLLDDLYRISVFGSGETRLKNSSGEVFNGGVNDFVTFTVDAQERVSFDFGTTGSALESGYARVTGADRYNALAGYGWLSGDVTSKDRGAGADPVTLTRDLNQTSDATFAVDVEPGTYEVTVTMGDNRKARAGVNLFLEGTLQTTVSTEVNEFFVQTFLVVVDDGQLTLRIQDSSGVGPINALSIASADFELKQVVSDSGETILDGDDLDQAPNELTLRFNADQDIDPNSLDGIRITRAGLDGEFGDANDVILTSASARLGAPNEVIIAFTDSLPDDLFQIAILGSGATPLQNTLGVAFNRGVDQFVTFSLGAPKQYSFDFGTSGSAVESRYTGVTGADRYNASAGYGWLSGDIQSKDRGAGADPVALTRDLNQTADGTFAVDVSSGSYEVTVTIGDNRKSRDGVNLFLEGELQATVATAVGEFFTQTFLVNVDDGQLTLRLQDDDGVAPINALTITAPVGAEHQPSMDFVLQEIQSDVGGPIVDGETLIQGPSELTFLFSAGLDIDPASLGGIVLTGAGLDGTFGDVNDVVFTPLTATLNTPNEATLVFIGTIPDDLYQISIFGTGPMPLLNTLGEAFNGGVDQLVTFTVATPIPPSLQLIEMNSNLGGGPIQDGDILNQSPTELTFLFGPGQELDLATLTGPTSDVLDDGIQVVRSGFDGIFGTADDVIISPAFIGLGDNPNDAIIRFNDTLPDDLYQITLFGTGLNPLRDTSGDAFNDGVDIVRTLELDLGAQIVAIIPQPVTASAGSLVQNDNQIVVHFNEDDLDPASAIDPRFYQLIDTKDTLEITDDTIQLPTNVVYDDVANTVTLTYASIPEGTYRLRIGEADLPSTLDLAVGAGGDDNSSFASATTFSGAENAALGAGDLLIVNASIQPQSIGLPPLPGGLDEPGHRGINVETHFGSVGTVPVVPGVITQFEYNFQDVIGTDPQGNTLFNLISEEEKLRAREIFELYAEPLGIEFIETDSSGLTVASGDMRVVSPDLPIGPGGVAGISGVSSVGQIVVMDPADTSDPTYAGSWMGVALHEIGHALGLGHSYDIPSIQGAGLTGEPIFVGDHDFAHLSRLFRPDATDIDLYEFELVEAGLFTAEIFAERLTNVSLLNSALTLYRENTDGSRDVIARNDDYYSNDAFLELDLAAGTYFIGVTSTGNLDYNPRVSDTGSGGTTDGNYELRFSFLAAPTSGDFLIDATGTAFDGDADGVVGGVHDFWFQAGETIFVDKANSASSTQDGSLADPFSEIDAALSAVTGTTDIVRIVGNGGTDGDLATPEDAQAYQIGFDDNFVTLQDGITFIVPQDVTVMIDQGVVIKLQNAIIEVGSSSELIDRSQAALQILGTPDNQVVLTSNGNDAIGGDTDGVSDGANPGDWGGVVFRGDSDLEDDGIFINYVNQTDITFGGGQVFVDSILDIYNPIHVIDARPTLSFNTITQSADAAISASLDSFADTILGNRDATLSRIGLDVHGNTVINNSINGLFVAVETNFGKPIDNIDISVRFDDVDIVHVVTENIQIAGSVGGAIIIDGVLQARESGRLRIDGGIIVKLSGSRIEAERGHSNFIAEGSEEQRVTFTSIFDDGYGRGGTSDTTNDTNTSTASKGDWGGIILNAVSNASIDHAFFAFGGGLVPIEGRFDNFNVIEAHQADLRLTNSRLENNADGRSITTRTGRGQNDNTTVFIRGAQPIFVGNEFVANGGTVVSINANSMRSDIVRDLGRSTGFVDAFTQFPSNRGPLARLNRFEGNAINGMEIRAEELTIESVWDDTDIVHVLNGEIRVPNFHTFGGLRLESSSEFSLVIKLEGANAGFSAAGNGLDIDDRIGGVVQIVGQPLNPVILTSLSDDSVGAGLDINDQPQNDTNGDGAPPATVPATASDTQDGHVHEGSHSHTDDALIDDYYGDDIYGDGTDVVVDTHMEHDSHPDDSTSDVPTILFGDSLTLYGPHHTDPGHPGTPTTHFFAETGDADHFAWLDQDFSTPSVIDINYDFRDLNGVTNVITAGQMTMAELALQAWENATLGAINFVRDTTSPDAAVVIIGTGNLSALGGTSGVGGVLGLGGGTFNHNALHTITSGSAWQDSAETWDEIFNNGNPTGTFDYFTIAAQEIGHAIGLGHTNDIPGPDLMDGNYSGEQTGVSINDIAHIQVVYGVGSGGGGGTGAVAQPGDWRSIRLQEFSFDRNVELVNESEGPLLRDLTDEEQNATVGEAQFLGELAPNEKSGDENRRLGFEVHGFIGADASDDRDVYSFNADVGTEVWIDIDRTDPTLNVVIELIDPNDNVLAMSINNNNLSGLAFPLMKDGLQGGDFYTSNPNDPGMRVILPGSPGQTTTYFVRIRSENGLTSGHYELQIRLRQTDEQSGSVVRHSDIRFATNGIEILGLPGHSPLTGTTGDREASGGTSNNSLATAQDVGNLLVSDRAAIAIAGVLSSSTDLDFYQFEIRYDDVQSIPGVTSAGLHTAAVFDIDYADGLARANTILSIFDANGSLVFSSTDSNVAEDRPAPEEGNDIDDLSRGSVGALDPFIGAVELAEGIYFAVVSSNLSVPVVLDQFFNETTAGALTRLEPINSLVRIVEDHIGAGTFATAEAPVVLELINTFNPFNDQESSIVPFNLGDMVLLVSSDPAGNNNTRITTVDPFTGQQETSVGIGTAVGPVHDIVLRGLNLMGFSLAPEDVATSDANTGHLISFDTGDATATDNGDDGILTFVSDTTQTPPAVVAANTGGQNGPGVGIDFEAITNTGGVAGSIANGYFAVGSRGDAAANPSGIEITTNILYQFNAAGVALSTPGLDRTGDARANGAGTQIVERGELDTLLGTTITFVEATTITPPDAPLPSLTNFVILDGLTFTVDSGVVSETYELNSGIDMRLLVDPDANIQAIGEAGLTDETTFQITTVLGGTDTYELDTAGNGVIGLGNIAVTINTGDSAVQVAQAIELAITVATNGATAIAVGDTVGLGDLGGIGVTFTDVDTGLVLADPTIIGDGAFFLLDSDAGLTIAPNPPNRPVNIYQFDTGFVFEVGDGETILDGDIIAITDNAGFSLTINFEFDEVGSPGVTPGNVAVSYNAATDDSDAVIASLLTTVNGIFGFNTQLTQLTGTNRVTAGFSNQVTENSANGLIVIATAGSSPILQMPVGGSLGLAAPPDGATFELRTRSGTETFEIDFGDGVAAGNIVVLVAAGQTSAQAGQIIAQTINSIDRNGIQAVAGVAAGGTLVDGEFFSITTSNGTALFEFDSDGNRVLANFVTFTAGSTAVQVAANIKTAIDASGIGATADVIGDRVFLNGPNVRFNSVAGIQGVAEAGLNDETTFQITAGGVTDTYELDTLGNGIIGGVGTIPVNITAGDTDVQVAQAIVTAIAGATNGATATLVENRVLLAGANVTFTNVDSGLLATVDTIAGTARFGATATAVGFTTPLNPNDDQVIVSGADILFDPQATNTTVLFDLTDVFDPDGGGPIGNMSPVRSIRIAETDTADQNGQAIVPVVQAVVDPQRPLSFAVGADGARVNFVGATAISEVAVFDAFSSRILPDQLFQQENDILGALSAEGVILGNVQIDFLAEDTAIDIATTIFNIMQAIPAVPGTLPASVAVSQLLGTLTIDANITADFPFTVTTGLGVDGEITGLAVIGPGPARTLYAVDDEGGLYRIDNPTSRNASAAFIADIGGLGINFQGLAEAPRNVEQGLFADLLLGISRSGQIYAFNTSGELQPIFVDGRTSISTGLGVVNGLAFSDLQANLWSITPEASAANSHRQNDPGHGINAAVDLSRESQLGGASIQFGTSRTGTFAAAGGAHGSVESGLFSLEGYSAADQPVLYFNYFLESEDVSSSLIARDTLRVFVSDDDGIWHLLATNNLVEPEFGDPDPFDDVVVNVQQLFDNQDQTSWRQARINLTSFAGKSNLKLRFDFSSAGSMNTGDTNTTGDELRAIPGFALRDGDTFSIDGQQFEFDLGITIVTPTGASISDGQMLTIDGTVFEFDSNGTIMAPQGIAFTSSQTAEEIAQSVRDAVAPFVTNAIKADQVNFGAFRDDMPLLTNRINLVGATTVTTTAPIAIEGAVGAAAGIQIVVDASFERYDLGFRATNFTGSNVPNVRDAIRVALANTFAVGQNFGNVAETEPNNGIAPFAIVDAAGNPLSQDVDTQRFWSLTQNGLIGDSNNVNTSTTIPHITIDGTGDGTFDYYRFDVRGASFANPITGIFDIDFGSTGGAGSMDTELFLYDGLGNFITSNDDSLLITLDAGSTSILDSFIEFDFTTDGTYVIGVGKFSSTGDPGGITGTPPDVGDTYTLHISIEDHPNDASGDVLEVEPNDSLATAQNVDDPSIWSLAADPLIADESNVDTSTTIPHISIQGSGDVGAFDTFDYYSFTVTGADVMTPVTGIFDVDFADPVGGPAVNTEIFIYSDSGLLIASNDNNAGPLDVGVGGSSSLLDSFLQFDFTVDGTYIIGIAEFDSTGDPGGISGNALDDGETYTLHISLEGHANNSGVPVTGEVDTIKVYKEVVRIIGHNVGDAGPLGLTSGLQGDQFGSFNRNLRGQNNGFEGAYIDDIVIGFAERGEMVTGAPNDATFALNGASSSTDVLVGEYQLQIRRTDDYGITDPATGALGLFSSSDTNDRLTGAVTFVAPSGIDIFDGQTFRLSNTFRDSTVNPIVTFEYVDLAVRTTALAGNVAILFRTTDTANTIAERIRNAINSDSVHDILNARAALSDGALVGDLLSTSNLVNVFGNPAGDPNGSLNFGDIPVLIFNTFGDQNNDRSNEQGQLIIQSNQIRDVSQFGIRFDSGQRDSGSNLPHPGTVRNLLTLNPQALVPAVVIENNVISFFGQGGIFFSGDTNTGSVPNAAVPFGRIVNNTIYGGETATGVGIQVTDNASPTILNNIVANTDAGISVSGNSSTTVVGTTVFQGNNVDGNLGTNAIFVNVSDPLFVNPLGGNFYLAAGSRAIDSSLNRLAERPEVAIVTDPLGIDPSDIFAPEFDVFGQLRVDDPLQAPPPGLGFRVFTDRGAVERADFVGPTAVLVVPLDNGPLDRDDEDNAVFVLAPLTVGKFTLLLSDVGIGLDELNIRSSQFQLRRGAAVLLDGIDYVFDFNANTSRVTFSSISTSFELDVYTINVDNSGTTGVRDLAGNRIRPNQADGSTRFTIALGPEVSINDIDVVEGDTGITEAIFTVTLSALPDSTITVDVVTSDGTATVANNDYTPLTTTVTFNPGDPLTKTVTVQIIGDTIPEVDETFFVDLVSVSPNARIADNQGIGTIINDDIPSFSVDDFEINPEGDVGDMFIGNFRVRISGLPTAPISVDVSTILGGTATAGVDYVPIGTTTLTFTPTGPLFIDVPVTVIGDLTAEDNETIFLQLTNLMGDAVIGDPLGVATIIDDEPFFTISDATMIPELDAGMTSMATFTVTLSKPAAAGMVVTVEVVTGALGDTATAGDDYDQLLPVPKILTFVNGQPLTQTVMITINGDDVDEFDETFSVILQNASSNASIRDTVGIGTIINDDDPSISIDDIRIDPEGDTGVTTATFTVNLSVATNEEVTVDISTADGTVVGRSANAGSDYISLPPMSQVTFAAGESTQTFTVDIVTDLIQEDTEEDFFVNLSNATKAAIADAQAIATIVDDDAPDVTIDDVTLTILEGGDGGSNIAVFTIRLSQPGNRRVSIDFATADGTGLGAATAGSDYTATSGTLIFSVGGQLTQQILVPIIGDSIIEGNETFVLNLFNAINANLVDTQGQVTIINDDPVAPAIAPSTASSSFDGFVSTTADSDPTATSSSLILSDGGELTQQTLVSSIGGPSDEVAVTDSSDTVDTSLDDFAEPAVIENDDFANDDVASDDFFAAFSQDTLEELLLGF